MRARVLPPRGWYLSLGSILSSYPLEVFGIPPGHLFRRETKITGAVDVPRDEHSPASAAAAGPAAVVPAWLVVQDALAALALAGAPRGAAPASPEELAVPAVSASPGAVQAALAAPDALAAPAARAAIAALVATAPASWAWAAESAVPPVIAARALSPGSAAMGRGWPAAASSAAVRPDLTGSRRSTGSGLAITTVCGLPRFSATNWARLLPAATLICCCDPQLRQTRLAQGGQFCRGRRKIHATAATAVAHAIVVRDVGHVGDVGVADDSGVHVRDLAVVAELVVVPISAVITATDITVAVIHTTVVADVASPKSTMPSITVAVIAPVPRSP